MAVAIVIDFFTFYSTISNLKKLRLPGLFPVDHLKSVVFGSAHWVVAFVIQTDRFCWRSDDKMRDLQQKRYNMS